MSKLSELTLILFSAGKQSFHITEITIDAESFNSLLWDLQGMIKYKPSTGEDGSLEVKDFTYAVPYGHVTVKKGSK